MIEGDTERMLIPTMMKKIDIEEAAVHKAKSTEDDYLPLLSQNISIVEVGAYSQIFDKFIEFLGIKTLIITDLDAIGADNKKCEVANAVAYSNEALSYYFSNPTLADLKTFSFQDKLFNNIGGCWKINLMVDYVLFIKLMKLIIMLVVLRTHLFILIETL